MSLETGTFSGSQKLPVSRSQTSASFSSCSRFQLIAETRSISFILLLTRTPLHQTVCLRYSGLKHYPWGTTRRCNTTTCARRVVQPGHSVCRRPPSVQAGVAQGHSETVFEGAQRDVGEATQFVLLLVQVGFA